jgi:ABC-2 type transport system ATP-binding protein
VPGELSLYSDLTGRQLLTYLGNLQGQVDAAYRDSLIERLELDPTKRIKSLSRGNKQKVGLVAAFMIRPELLILDEATAGLDPFIQLEFEHLCEEARDEGRTVFISSHQLPEVEHLCDRVGIIREGRLLAVETIAGLKERALRRIEIDFIGAVDAEAFANLPGVSDLIVRRRDAALHGHGQRRRIDQGRRPLRGPQHTERRHQSRRDIHGVLRIG